jgi:hypothetical protein
VQDNELPNDDSHDADEDNTPSNSFIYAYDGPSRDRAAGNSAFEISRNTFVEWVRVQLNNTAFVHAPADATGNNLLAGSRASVKEHWHEVYYLKRGADGILNEDPDDVSACSPRRIGGGNGVAAVAVDVAAVTEGFTATYNLANRRWTLTGTGGNMVNDAVAGAVPAGTIWMLSLAGRVTVTITQGAAAFANGDRFEFSVFRTGNVGGKRNQIGAGPFNARGVP